MFKKTEVKKKDFTAVLQNLCPLKYKSIKQNISEKMRYEYVYYKYGAKGGKNEGQRKIDCQK